MRKAKGAAGAVLFFFLVLILCPIQASAERRPVRKNDAQRTVHSAQAKEEAAVEEKVIEPAADAAAQPDKAADKGQAKAQGEGASRDQFSLYDSYSRPAEEPESYGWLIFKTIFIIGVLLGGFYYFFRFVTKKAGLQIFGKEVVQVLSAVPVGQGKFIQVIDLAGRILVIGVTDSAISVITEIKEKDEIDRIRLLSSKSMPIQENTFQDFIVKQVGKLFKKGETAFTGMGRPRSVEHAPEEAREERHAGDVFDRLGYLRKQKDRLRKLNGADDEN